jgi:serine/threonine-protein kinase RsbW
MAEPLTFDVRKNKDGIDIVLSSTMDCIDKADAVVKRFLEDMELDHHSFAVRVVMREGLTNSVRHAHRLDPGKLIRFRLKIQGEKLTMIIEDQGEGFDWRSAFKVAAPETTNGSLLDHGRGFLIMNDYFDRWVYNEKGNVLTLEKNISS